MMHLQRLAGEFFARLEKLDEMIAATVAAGRCRHCAGPLHQGNYHRKPRGAFPRNRTNQRKLSRVGVPTRHVKGELALHKPEQGVLR